MEVLSIDITLNELSFIRQALDVVSVSGKDAKFLASLQTKIETDITEATAQLEQMQQKKSQELQNIIEAEQKKTSSKK